MTFGSVVVWGLFTVLSFDCPDELQETLIFWEIRVMGGLILVNWAARLALGRPDFMHWGNKVYRIILLVGVGAVGYYTFTMAFMFAMHFGSWGQFLGIPMVSVALLRLFFGGKMFSNAGANARFEAVLLYLGMLFVGTLLFAIPGYAEDEVSRDGLSYKAIFSSPWIVAFQNLIYTLLAVTLLTTLQKIPLFSIYTNPLGGFKEEWETIRQRFDQKIRKRNPEVLTEIRKFRRRMPRVRFLLTFNQVKEKRQILKDLEEMEALLAHLYKGGVEIDEGWICADCYCRAIAKTMGKFQYPVCPSCDSQEHLTLAYDTITGIMGDSENTKDRSRELAAEIWSQDSGWVHPMEMDVLEIFGSKDFPYEKAFDRVIAEWTNRHPNGGKRPKLRLQQKPALSTNTLRQLADFVSNPEILREAYGDF